MAATKKGKKVAKKSASQKSVRGAVGDKAKTAARPAPAHKESRGR